MSTSAALPAAPDGGQAPAPAAAGAFLRAATSTAAFVRARRRWLVPVVMVAVFAGALVLLRGELRHYHYRDVAASARAIPAARLLAALGLTAVGYLLLAGYDALALHYVGARLRPRRLLFASFIAYAFSQSLGFPVLTGGSVRYRFWTAWGIAASRIARAVAFSAVTFWLGVLTVGGLALVLEPLPPPVARLLPVRSLAPLGALLLAVVAAYVVATAARREPLRVRGWTVAVPGPGLALAQVAVGALDWVAAGGVAYALMPRAPGLTVVGFVGLFLVAQVAGLVSHVPGGLGVFETVLLLLLGPFVPAHAVLAALLAYRAVYYLAPFALAVLLFGGHELLRHRRRVAAATRATSGWLGAAVPTGLAVATFASGAVLLASGATPSAHGRLELLGRLVPLGVIELSHFAGSVAGVALVVLAWALQRRLDAAWGLSVALLVVGVVASLLKGLDWEEALVLATVLAAVLPARRRFYRRSALLAEPFSPGWAAAVAMVVGATLWLGAFAYQHVPYDADLWWRVSLRGDAPRFLRASVGAVGVLLAFGLARLLRHASVAAALPTADALARARAVLARARETDASLALVGDKALLFDEGGEGFVMYAVSGRSWVAMGDPVGSDAARAELAWRFRELADRHGGWPVFYEVRPEHLPLYVDLGLGLLKLGEEAIVPLGDFSLDGGARKGLRRALRDGRKAGLAFEVAEPDAVPALLPELARVSDEWLATRHTREKGFSLGRFDPAYLANFPVALVRAGDGPGAGRVVAFANVWRGAGRHELSVDLMRFAADAPHGTMDYLFVELLLWGKAAGWATFTLGMAPLSGLQSRRLGPLWNRAGALLYRHGEHFYNFQGLRRYKEKFDPTWAPRYLASPGGLALPRILANVASLISGGLTGIVAAGDRPARRRPASGRPSPTAPRPPPPRPPRSTPTPRRSRAPSASPGGRTAAADGGR